MIYSRQSLNESESPPLFGFFGDMSMIIYELYYLKLSFSVSV